MIRVIYGKKGSGKTKRIIDMANIASKENDGALVFIDDDNRYMFDLHHEIRFVNATEYSVSSPDMFLGFLCGIISSNYDMSCLFIDGFLRLVKADIADLAPLFERLEKMAVEHNVTVVISVSGAPEEAPEFIKPYLI
jgi:hypothetical protein